MDHSWLVAVRFSHQQASSKGYDLPSVAVVGFGSPPATLHRLKRARSVTTTTGAWLATKFVPTGICWTYDIHAVNMCESLDIARPEKSLESGVWKGRSSSAKIRHLFHQNTVKADDNMSHKYVVYQRFPEYGTV